MLSIEELEKYPEYWLEEVQNKMHYNFKQYMKDHNLNQRQLSNKLGISTGRVSQILNGTFNHTIKKYIELCLAIDMIPVIEFKKNTNKKVAAIPVVKVFNMSGENNWLNQEIKDKVNHELLIQHH